jgi:hypothetical protein
MIGTGRSGSQGLSDEAGRSGAEGRVPFMGGAAVSIPSGSAISLTDQGEHPDGYRSRAQ